MNINKISHEIGKMIYVCDTQLVNIELYSSVSNLIKELENKLDMESVVQGITDMWNEYEYIEMTPNGIADMLETFELKYN